MKDGVRILNCARGGIIDEEALYQAILDGKVAGAALDVFESEPPEDHPLLSLPQVIATPHLGASTVEAQENVALDVAEEVLHILRGEPFKNAVNLPSVPAELNKNCFRIKNWPKSWGNLSPRSATAPCRKSPSPMAGKWLNLMFLH